MDYMVYAYLQLARDNDARARYGGSRTGIRLHSYPPAPTQFAAIPARYAIERGDWSGAMKLQPSPK